MAIEEVIINIKDVARLKGLARTEDQLLSLKRVGFNVDEALSQVRGRLRALGDTGRKASLVFSRFRGELLSVLFFGMALKNTFQSMFNPAAKMLGIFEYWSNVMAILFLPIMIALLPFILELGNYLMNLPEPVQMIIGAIALLISILGSILMIIGVFGLGLSGLLQVFPGLAGVITWFGGIWSAIFYGLQTLFFQFIGWVTALSAPVLVVIGIIIAAIIGFWLAWQENFGLIRSWVEAIWLGIQNIFGGIWDILKGLVTLLIGIFTGNKSKVIEGATLMWEGVKKVFWGIIQFVGGFIVTLGLALFRAIVGLVDILGQAFGFVWETVFQPLGQAFIDFVAKPIKDTFISVINWVIDQINGMIKAINKVSIALGLGSVIPELDKIGIKQTGGFVPETGLYQLERGERVSIPNENTINFSPNITVNATSNVDIDALVDQLSGQLRDQVENLNRR